MHEYLFLCCYPCYAGCRYKNRVAPFCSGNMGHVKEEVVKMKQVKDKQSGRINPSNVKEGKTLFGMFLVRLNVYFCHFD